MNRLVLTLAGKLLPGSAGAAVEADGRESRFYSVCAQALRRQRSESAIFAFLRVCACVRVIFRSLVRFSFLSTGKYLYSL